jgi:hypothetical protein
MRCLRCRRFAEWVVAIAACALAGTTSAQVDFGDDASQWARDGECDDPRFAGEGSAETLVEADLYHDATDCRTLFDQGRVMLAAGSAPAAAPNGSRVARGSLSQGDETLTSGEFADTYAFVGTRGGQAVIDLRSNEFDPYLLVRAPDGAQFDNDDYNGDAGRSLLSLDLDLDGTYRVTVTSYRVGETGGYTIEITLPVEEQATTPIEHSGTLQAGDAKLTSGEYVDSFEFDGMLGQHVAIDLTSDDFDTYLILKEPSGKQTENDDADGSGDVGHSVIETNLTQDGTYRVLVTSNKTGEKGSYRLTIDRSDGSRERSAPRTDGATLTVGWPQSGAPVRMRGLRSAHQHLVVERGRRGPFDALFEH